MTALDVKQGVGALTLSVPDAAAFLNVSRETVRNLLQEGQLEGYRLGKRKIVVLKQSLQRYLEEQRAVPAYDERAQARLREQRRQRQAAPAPRGTEGRP
ncbi:MAG TPA: helix-turn-helix domain-containing protein [bacterium]|nr:helix-turn-helix domain-containing protein [bacterium]